MRCSKAFSWQTGNNSVGGGHEKITAARYFGVQSEHTEKLTITIKVQKKGKK